MTAPAIHGSISDKQWKDALELSQKLQPVGEALRSRAATEEAKPGFFGRMLAPLYATQLAGAYAYGNVLAPLMNKLTGGAGLYSQFDEFGQYEFGSLPGVLGQSQQTTGLRRDGREIAPGAETGTIYESLLQERDPQAMARVFKENPRLMTAAMYAGEIGTDPLTWIDLATAPAVIGARRGLSSLRSLRRAGESRAAVGRIALERLGRLPGGTAGVELFHPRQQALRSLIPNRWLKAGQELAEIGARSRVAPFLGELGEAAALVDIPSTPGRAVTTKFSIGPAPEVRPASTGAAPDVPMRQRLLQGLPPGVREEIVERESNIKRIMAARDKHLALARGPAMLMPEPLPAAEFTRRFQTGSHQTPEPLLQLIQRAAREEASGSRVKGIYEPYLLPTREAAGGSPPPKPFSPAFDPAVVPEPAPGIVKATRPGEGPRTAAQAVPIRAEGFEEVPPLTTRLGRKPGEAREIPVTIDAEVSRRLQEKMFAHEELARGLKEGITPTEAPPGTFGELLQTEAATIEGLPVGDWMVEESRKIAYGAVAKRTPAALTPSPEMVGEVAAAIRARAYDPQLATWGKRIEDDPTHYLRRFMREEAKSAANTEMLRGGTFIDEQGNVVRVGAAGEEVVDIGSALEGGAPVRPEGFGIEGMSRKELLEELNPVLAKKVVKIEEVKKVLVEGGKKEKALEIVWNTGADNSLVALDPSMRLGEPAVVSPLTRAERAALPAKPKGKRVALHTFGGVGGEAIGSRAHADAILDLATSEERPLAVKGIMAWAEAKRVKDAFDFAPTQVQEIDGLIDTLHRVGKKELKGSEGAAILRQAAGRVTGMMDEAPLSEIGKRMKFSEASEGVIKGWIRMEGDAATLHLTRYAGPETFDHELVHWFKETGLIDSNDWGKLTQRYAEGVGDAARAEEMIADGLSQHNLSDAGILQRIREFFSGLYEQLTGRSTTAGAQRRFRKQARAFAGAKEQAAPGVTTRLTVRGAPEPVTTKFSKRSVIEQAIEAQHVRRAEGAPKEGLIQKLKKPESRHELYTAIKEKGWDDLVRVREAMINTVGKKLVHKGKAAAHVVLQNLSGSLSNTRQVMLEGIPIPGRPGKMYYSGSMADNILSPLVKQAGQGAKEKDILRLKDMADQYMVAKRADWLHYQAVRAIDEPYTAGNVLVKRGIVGSEDVLQSMSRDELVKAVDNWAAGNTGLSQGIEGVRGDLEAARAIISEVENGPEGLAKTMELVSNEVSKVNEAKLNYMRDKGLISKDTMDALQEQFGDYVPLQRVFEEFESGKGGGAGGFLRTLKGSEREIVNPVTQTLDSTVKSMHRADINEVFDRWLFSEFPDADLDIIMDMGVRQTDEAAAGAKNVKTVWHEGSPSFWEFDDPRMMRAVESIGRPEPTDALSKFGGLYKKAVQTMVTHSPDFAVRNIIRDSVHRAVFSEHGTGIFAGFQKFDPEMKKLWQLAGGDQAGFYEAAEVTYNKQISRSIRGIVQDKKNILLSPEQMKDFLSQSWEKWHGVVSKTEEQNRLAEFVSAIEDVKQANPGMAHFEAARIAAYKSRKLMDFAVAGEWGRKINRFVPFFNAAIQGAAKTFRTVANNPALFAKRLGMYVVAPSIGTYMYNHAVGAGEEYLELPAYRRDLYWNFKVGDRWLVIPKPFEAGALGTGPERLIDAVVRGDTDAFSGYAGSLLRAVSPADEGALIGPFKPFVEILANRDFFRDKYIIPPHEENLDPRLRKLSKDRSHVGKFLSKMFGDPRQWEHVIMSVGGGAGRALIDLTGPKPGVARTLTGSMVREPSAYSLRSVQEVLSELERKGEGRTRQARSFKDKLRRAMEGKVSTSEILRLAKRQLPRLERVKITDKMRRLK